MDALEVIFTRRSVRSFSSEPVSKENIDTILKASMSAPSARNEQPWHFLVIDDRALLNKIAEVHPHAKMCAEATLAIIPCVIPSTYNIDVSFWIQDMSAAVENILLAARSLNLGSVWTGVYPRENLIRGIQQLFNLPETVIPFCVIPIGHTDVKQEQADRYRLERVHYNKWV
jgi:nitroreductase